MRTPDTAIGRARRAAAELLRCYEEAADTSEREAVAAIVAELADPRGGRALAELAADALAEARW